MQFGALYTREQTGLLTHMSLGFWFHVGCRIMPIMLAAYELVLMGGCGAGQGAQNTLVTVFFIFFKNQGDNLRA